MTRKVWDDAAGKHVARKVALRDGDIFELAEHVKRAHDVKCPICNAKPGEKCWSVIDASVCFDVPHAGRIEFAQREIP